MEAWWIVEDWYIAGEIIIFQNGQLFLIIT